MIDLDTLRLYLAIVSHGSFVAGAEERGLSKASASKAIRKLEDRIGTRLLDRTTRSVSPTHAGRLLLERAPELLRGYDNLIDELREDSADVSGRLRLAAPASFDNHLLGRLIARFAEKAPKAELDISLSDDFVNLIEGGFDAAIRITDLPDSTLIARRICDVNHLVVASPDYIKIHSAPEHPNELTDHACIEDRNMRHSKRWAFQEGGQAFRVPIRSRLRMNSPNLSVALAVAGHGIAMTPDFAAKEALAEGQLIRLLTDFAMPPIGMHIVYPDRRLVPERLRLFIQTAIEVLRDET